MSTFKFDIPKTESIRLYLYVAKAVSTAEEAEAEAASTVDEAVADEVVTEGVPTADKAGGRGQGCVHGG